MVHAPALQVLVWTWESAQMVPQALQFAGSVLRLTSQPVDTVLSQLEKPALHDATVQALLVHPGVPLATLHTVLHVPQWLTSAAVLISQPSETVPLQSV